jgi:DNA polymerase elongation subunit (family B)
MKRKGIDIRAGQKVRYIVRDQNSKPRVKLKFEDMDRYDRKFYIEKLEDAAESVLRPFNYSKNRQKDGISAFI